MTEHIGGLQNDKSTQPSLALLELSYTSIRLCVGSMPAASVLVRYKAYMIFVALVSNHIIITIAACNVFTSEMRKITLKSKDKIHSTNDPGPIDTFQEFIQMLYLLLILVQVLPTNN